MKNNNYNNTIIPTRISHINKEEETMNNDIISNQYKDKKINRDSKNIFKNNSEKKKKFIFLKRTKTKKIMKVVVMKIQKIYFSVNKQYLKQILIHHIQE